MLQITRETITIVKKFDIHWELPKGEAETWNDQILFLKIGAHRIVQCRVMINSQFVKMKYLGSAVKRDMYISKARNINRVQIRKGVCQGCIVSLCLFIIYAKHIMQNVGLDEAQAGIKIVGRNINNLRYADDTTLMAEIKEELKSLLKKVKEQSKKSWLKT